jgi:hypothetical protein
LSYSRVRGLDSSPKRVRLRPQCRGDSERIDSGLRPPFGFITAAVDLTMMDTAKRDRELVADLAPERRMLGKPEMVRVSRPPATDQARLFADELDMRFVADPARLGPRQGSYRLPPVSSGAVEHNSYSRPAVHQLARVC